MGTYEKSFYVDGEEYELYRQTDIEGDFIGYELVTHRGEIVNDGLLDVIPNQLDVVALVRERVERKQGTFEADGSGQQ